MKKLQPSSGESLNQRALQHDTVVIAIPAYNEERFVLEALKSVQSQTHGDFLAVISDNGSTDNTAEICRAFCQADSRFALIAQPSNLGANVNFQWLIENTGSPYFMWLGSHDLISRDFLEKHLSALSGDLTLSLSYSNIRCINQVSEFINVKDGGNYHRIAGTPAQRYRRTLKRMGPAEAINSLFRRAALQGIEFRPVLSLDRMMLCQAAYWGQFNKIDEPLYVRRFIKDREDGRAARLVRIKGKVEKEPSSMPTIREFQRQFGRLEKSWIERALLGKTVWLKYSKKAFKDIKGRLRRRYRTAPKSDD